MSRVRESLKNPVLVGKGGYRLRYLRIQWLVLAWRALMLVQIPEVALVRPSLISPLPLAFFLFALALLYSVAYYLLATRTRAGGRLWFHAMDIAICAGLMFLARDPKLLFIMAFYSYSSLLARPTTLFRVAAPATAALVLAFLAAEYSLGVAPLQLIGQARDVDNLVLYFFFGLGFVGFSGVLEEVSALEMESLLEEQRRSYRRRLHDDLGNTICGLHYRIQSLKRSGGAELGKALDFLAAGYDRAREVMERLLGGFQERDQLELKELLIALKRELEEAGLEVRIDLPPGLPVLNPGLLRQVGSIVREALTNVLKHSGAGWATVRVERRGRQLRIAVLDNGRGFDPGAFRDPKEEVSAGITGMRERAATLRGDLSIRSENGAGTGVTLAVDVPGRNIFYKFLDCGPAGGGLYRILARLRAIMAVWMLAHLALTSGGGINLAAVATSGLLIADSLAFLLFGTAVYRLFSRNPRLLAAEAVFFIMLINLCLQSGAPFFFSLYVGLAMVMNGLFLDTIRNLALTLFVDLGMLGAYLIAPASSPAVVAGLRLEEPLQHAIIFLILAFAAGMAGEFVRSLEGLQAQSIARALARQREQLTAETHRQLQALIEGFGADIRALATLNAGPVTEAKSRLLIDHLEANLRNMKLRLRFVLRRLEALTGEAAPAGDPAASERHQESPPHMPAAFGVNLMESRKNVPR